MRHQKGHKNYELNFKEKESPRSVHNWPAFHDTEDDFLIGKVSYSFPETMEDE